MQIPQPVERDMERDRMTRPGRPAGHIFQGSHSNRQPTVAINVPSLVSPLIRSEGAESLAHMSEPDGENPISHPSES